MNHSGFEYEYCNFSQKHMNAKDKPWLLLDTHAGAGVYAIDSEQAKKTGEYIDGIARLWNRVDLPAPVEDMTVDFALLRGVLVTGTIADADGKPCSNVYVAAVAFESSNAGSRFP